MPVYFNYLLLLLFKNGMVSTPQSMKQSIGSFPIPPFPFGSKPKNKNKTKPMHVGVAPATACTERVIKHSAEHRVSEQLEESVEQTIAEHKLTLNSFSCTRQ